MQQGITDKNWVLVTGASRGIGEAFARRFASEGWNLVLTARSRADLERNAGQYQQEYGSECLIIEEDLARAGSCQRIIREINDSGIALKGLVNNAGHGVSGYFVDAPMDRLVSMVQVNIQALMELTYLVLPDMISRQHGLIINVSSVASFYPLPTSAVYGATKAFVTSFSEALWMETRGKGVQILNVCPGWTKTDFGKASGGSTDFHKIPVAETPEQVVNMTFRKINNKTPTIISGWLNRFFVLMMKACPHGWLLRIVPAVKRALSRGAWFQNGRGETRA